MEEVNQILEKTGAVIRDSHFVYVSGKHSSIYVNKDYIYPHIKYVSRIAEIIAEKHKNKPIEVVVGPSIGGIILSQWVAYHLSRMKDKEILSVYTEKQPDKNQIFTRGYGQFVKGKNVLVVEDIVTTGGSVKKVINSVDKAGGKVLAACCIVNKDPEHINPGFIGVPFDYLTIVGVDVYDEKNCPLCKQNVPINIKIGHGKNFLERN
ncbi:MAG: phosphoribosyltransferase family protein [bacterium]|nr:phosphoribosyltransferase family protein [bacterium]